MEENLETIALKMETADELEITKLIEEQDSLLSLFQHLGGYRYRAHTEAVLHGLGFPKEMFSLEVSCLSGGQKNRLALARSLLTNSELLLLDEPTNFLDIESTLWLEEYLKSSKMAMIIVSHDRYFLNEVVTQVWELARGSMAQYRGNYENFQKQKDIIIENQQQSYERQQAEIKRQEDFIRRNIVGQKHKQAQSRRKMLEKIEKIEAPIEENQTIKLDFKAAQPRVDKILETKELGHHFDEKHLFRNLTFKLNRSEKLAIIGPNGCGKSTLLHIINGDIKAEKGSFSVGEKVKIGFYHQELQGLDDTKTVFDIIKDIIPTTDDLPIRNFLALFLFMGDDIYKEVASLSGGEKSRLALASLLIQKPNFLILDEPTNHLDIQSRFALENALKSYDGTLLFVSHDRYFIDEVADRILYFHKNDWIKFYGNYTSFYQSEMKRILTEEKEAIDKKKRMAHKKHQKAERKRRPKKQYTLEELEEKIINRETLLEQLTEKLGSEEIYQNPSKLQSIQEEYDKVTKELEELNSEWEAWE